MTRTERHLTLYAGVLTIGVIAALLTGAGSGNRATFEEIDVQRINLLEPDGTLRMTISNSARFPGLIYRGQEHPHPRPVAGALFFNDEGTENGGFVFGGRTLEDGSVQHGVHLSMDQYQQDQVIALNNIEQGGRRRSGLTVGDRPEHPIIDDVIERERMQALPEAEREALVRERAQAGHYGQDRLFVGRTGDRASVLDLRDEHGRSRLRLKVEADGSAAIEFLDEAGEVTGRVDPAALAHAGG